MLVRVRWGGEWGRELCMYYIYDRNPLARRDVPFRERQGKFEKYLCS